MATGCIHSLIDTGFMTRATQLDGFLQNLVNASRVTSEGVRPRLEMDRSRRHHQRGARTPDATPQPARIQVEFEGDLPFGQG